MRPRYVVEAEPSDRWYALSVPDVPGAFSQVLRTELDRAGAMASEAISLMLDVPMDSFDVEIVVVPERE